MPLGKRRHEPTREPHAIKLQDDRLHWCNRQAGFCAINRNCWARRMQTIRQAQKPKLHSTLTALDMHIGRKQLHILKPVDLDPCLKFFVLTLAHASPCLSYKSCAHYR